MLTGNTNLARIVPFPSGGPRVHPSVWQGFTTFAPPTLDQAQYETECLAGAVSPARAIRTCFNAAGSRTASSSGQNCFGDSLHAFMHNKAPWNPSLGCISRPFWMCDRRISHAR